MAMSDLAESYHNGFAAGAEAFHHLMDLLEPLVQGYPEKTDYVAICNAHAAVSHLVNTDGNEETR